MLKHSEVWGWLGWLICYGMYGYQRQICAVCALSDVNVLVVELGSQSSHCKRFYPLRHLAGLFSFSFGQDLSQKDNLVFLLLLHQSTEIAGVEILCLAWQVSCLGYKEALQAA